MTQRANINGTSIYAFQADERLWALWHQEYKAGNLTLPCCGGSAVPREHPASGVKFFSHAPYAARTCSWKATGAHHEELVFEASSVLDQIGWKVDTDCWIEEVSVDIVATDPDTGKRIAILIESAPQSERPDDTLIAENKRIEEADLQSVMWLVPVQRYDHLKQDLLAQPYQRSEDQAENTIGNIAWLLRRGLKMLKEADAQAGIAKDSPLKPTAIPDHTPMPIVPRPTGIEADPEWQDGKTSIGSPIVRVNRLIRLANRWLPSGHADKWLQRVHPAVSFKNSPIGAAECSASGYLEAQEALKADIPNEQQSELI